eukprot:scaffold18144_cov130-Isochrysis_galbana.AAC.12
MRGGFNSPAQKQAHFTSTRRRGKEGTRGREKEPTPRVPREVDQRTGAFPHPFRGREESCDHIQAMWGPSFNTHLHEVCCCLRPHTIIPLPWRERGIQFPSTKASTLHEHTATRRRGKGKEGTNKGAGKGTYTRQHLTLLRQEHGTPVHKTNRGHPQLVGHFLVLGRVRPVIENLPKAPFHRNP